MVNTPRYPYILPLDPTAVRVLKHDHNQQPYAPTLTICYKQGFYDVVSDLVMRAIQNSIDFSIPIIFRLNSTVIPKGGPLERSIIQNGWPTIAQGTVLKAQTKKVAMFVTGDTDSPYEGTTDIWLDTTY